MLYAEPYSLLIVPVGIEMIRGNRGRGKKDTFNRTSRN